ncbi:YggT family protein [Bacillaceae bacterium S4-13-56]
MRDTAVLVYLINTVIGIAQFILGIRVILKLLDANQSTPFVQWVYQTSSSLLYPFEGIFPAPALDGRFVFYSFFPL